jgi:SAM-dependent methyltransferase
LDGVITGEELNRLWRNPAERQARHLAWRDTATTFLTAGAAGTEDFALPRIAAALQSSAAFQTRSFLLDVGCGPGYYLAALLENPALPLQLAVGLDCTPGALQKAQDRLRHRPGGSLVQADILRLPFGSATFGAAMCNRMLNQTGDIAGSLAAVAATLVADGLLFIVTADTGEVSPLREAHERIQAALGFPARIYGHTTRPGQHFNLANGPDWLAPAFKGWQVELYERRLRFEDPAQLGQYYASGLLFQKSSGLDEPALGEAHWRELYARVLAEMTQIIRANGHLSYREGAALFIARRK